MNMGQLVQQLTVLRGQLRAAEGEISSMKRDREPLGMVNQHSPKDRVDPYTGGLTVLHLPSDGDDTDTGDEEMQGRPYVPFVEL